MWRKFKDNERRFRSLQGTHPDLKEGTERDSNLVKTIHNSVIKHEVYHVHHYSHPEFEADCPASVKLVDVSKRHAHASFRPRTSVAESFTGRTQERQVEKLICGEEIGTEITPRCGSCRCGKCPTVGHTYSFKEEQELKMIRENLEYDSAKQCWVTSYPWLVDPGTLPNNYGSALATLKNTERKMSGGQRLTRSRWMTWWNEVLHESCLRKKCKTGVVLNFTSPTWQWSTHGHAPRQCESYLIPVKCAKECLLIPL